MDKIFNPKTVAVIGASNKEGSVGQALIQNLIGSGFNGTVYPINFRNKSIYGVRSYAKIADTRDQIDLAVIATPAPTVPEIVKECGENGVGGIVIISAGFMEVGTSGKRLVDEVMEYAKKYNIRIIGPNCLGFIKPSLKLNVSFANKMAKPGKIAFISQSGALCTAILDWSVDQNVGFSHFVSIGSMIDVGFHDLIDYFGRDSNTNSIVIYMESLTFARKFMSAARAFAWSKPIIVLKAGKSSAGAEVAKSHTGTLAGNEVAFEAAFSRAGIISVDTIEQLFFAAQALAMQPRPQGNRLAIITNAGGPGVLATDHLIKQGGTLSELSEKTIENLNKVLPDAWSHANPIDVLGDASSDRYKAAVKATIDGPNVDGLLIILTPQAMTHPAEIAKAVVEITRDTKKPVLASWMGESDVAEGREILEAGNIPVYRIPENAVNTFMSMYKYSRNIDSLHEMPSDIPHKFNPDIEASRALIKKAADSKRFTLTEDEAKQLLTNYQIPVTKNEVVKSEKSALAVAKKLGYPVVMKIASPDISHKSDKGGVILNIKNENQARDSYAEIIEAAKVSYPDADIHGVLVEQMIAKKYELIIGSQKDPIFGPVIVFGMGGVSVEIFKDLNVGLPPLNMALAKRMIEDTKIYELLRGYRGMEPVDLEDIQFLLYKFAYLVMDFPEIKEIDINPYVVDHEGGVVLDAKVVLDENTEVKEKHDYHHLVISPFPKEYTYTWKMKNNQEVKIRPIMPEDEPLEREFFAAMSRQTQYYRFFGYVGKVTHDMLAKYTQIDYDREMALIALVQEEDKKKMAGVVRILIDPEKQDAEFAVVVADQWQGQGLGSKLLDQILEIAKEREVKEIFATVMNANNVMLHMFRRRNFDINRIDEETCSVKLKL